MTVPAQVCIDDQYHSPGTLRPTLFVHLDCGGVSYAILSSVVFPHLERLHAVHGDGTCASGYLTCV